MDTGEVDPFVALERTTVDDASDEARRRHLEHHELDETIVDQNAVSDVNVFSKVIVRHRDFASLLLTFVGWEGVGLCSYLLIGFWYTDPQKAFCGRKAFVVNRIGDFGFLLGVFTLLSIFGTAEYGSIAAALRGASTDAVLSSGAFTTADAQVPAAQRLQRSSAAVLYALDARTGRELWRSGRTVT